MKDHKTIIYILVTITIFIYSTTALYSQDGAIKVGQKCPDVILEMFNYKNTSAKLSEFKEPLVILDFWATYCGSCIEGLLKYHKMAENEYRDKVRFIPVTHENRAKVEGFWRRNPNTKNEQIPMVIGDTLLKTYFPHLTVGLQVWLNNDMTVLAITDAEHVTRKNIDKLLKGDLASIPKRNDINYDLSKSLFVIDKPFADHVPYTAHSGLMGHLKGSLGTKSLKFDTTGTTVRMYSINTPILDLYKQALAYVRLSPSSNRFVLETADSSRYFIWLKKDGYDSEWEQKNTYCYEQTVSLGTTKEFMLSNMLIDLNRFLNLKGGWENKLQKCWVVKDISDGKPKFVKNSPPYYFRGLISTLNISQRKLPVIINESMVKDEDEIPLDIYAKIVNVQSLGIGELNNLLKHLNLYLSEEVRNVEKFVLSDY